MSKTDLEKSVQSITNLIQQCYAPHFKEGNERPCNELDFKQFLIDVLIHLKELKQVLLRNKDILFHRQIMTNLIILFGENNQRFLWNTEPSFQLCNEIRGCVFDGSVSENVILDDGLVGGKGMELRPLFKPVIYALRPNLDKETWKEYPASVQCFAWLLSIVKPLTIAEHTHAILPTALLLVDDFDNENRIIGVRCLSRIIEEMTIAELKFHGYGNLIYKGLERLLRERDDTLAEKLIPIVLSLVTKLETDFGDVPSMHKWSRFDDVMEIVLELAHMEDNVKLRTTYISLMPLIIKSLGDRIYRWAKRILAILDHYLDTAASQSDDTIIMHSLKTLQYFIQNTESVQACYRQNVVFTLLKLLHSLFENSRKDEEVFKMIILCLNLVQTKCSPEEVKNLIDEINGEVSDFSTGVKIVQFLKENLEKNKQ